MAQQGQFSQALQTVDPLEQPAPDLAFTRDGLQPFLESARFSYLTGSVYKTCNVPDKAQSSFRRAARKAGLADATWAWKSAQQLPDTDQNSAKQKLQSTLERI